MASAPQKVVQAPVPHPSIADGFMALRIRSYQPGFSRHALAFPITSIPSLATLCSPIRDMVGMAGVKQHMHL